MSNAPPLQKDKLEEKSIFVFLGRKSENYLFLGKNFRFKLDFSLFRRQYFLSKFNDIKMQNMKGFLLFETSVEIKSKRDTNR
jgi:hypothetical protein